MTPRGLVARPCAGHDALRDEGPALADAHAEQDDRRNQQPGRGSGMSRPMATRLAPMMAGPASSQPIRPGPDAPAVRREAAVHPSEALATLKPARQRIEAVQTLQEDRHVDLQRAVGDGKQQRQPQPDTGRRAQRKRVARQQGAAAARSSRSIAASAPIATAIRPALANGCPTIDAEDIAGDRDADQRDTSGGHARRRRPAYRRRGGRTEKARRPGRRR